MLTVFGVGEGRDLNKVCADLVSPYEIAFKAATIRGKRRNKKRSMLERE